MKIDQGSSGVAKAGLATGITGTTLGALNLMGNAGGILGGLFGGRNMACGYNAAGACCCSEDHLVDRFALSQESKIAKLETQIALRDANTFTDQKQLEMYKYVDGRLNAIEKQLCLQEVQNQKTADSFQLVSERMQCCCDSLSEKICRERDERKCSDNALVNYVNATFYPKQVADVTTGTTTTPQTLFNPLPAQRSECGNCCC